MFAVNIGNLKKLKYDILSFKKIKSFSRLLSIVVFQCDHKYEK